MWIAIVSKVWKYRNKIVFQNGVTDDIKILAVAQMKAWLWAKI